MIKRRELPGFVLVALCGAIGGYFLGHGAMPRTTSNIDEKQSGLSAATSREGAKVGERRDEIFKVLVEDPEPSMERLWQLFTSPGTTSAAARRAVLLRLLESDPEGTLDRLVGGVSDLLSDSDLEKTAVAWVRRNPEVLADAWSHRVLFHIEHFGDLAGATSGATVDIQIENIARLAAKGSADEAAMVSRFALSGLGTGTLPQYDKHGDAAKMVDFLQRAELFESEQIRSLQRALTHRWELVPGAGKLALSDELAQLPSSAYRDIATATLIEHYLESGTPSSLTSEKIVSLFDAVPRSDQIDTLFAEGLEKLSASGNEAKAIEGFDAACPNPITPWERMLSNRLRAQRK